MNRCKSSKHDKYKIIDNNVTTHRILYAMVFLSLVVEVEPILYELRLKRK